MIPFEKAFDIVMNSCFRTGSETVPFEDSLGRVLAEDVKSDLDMPPFDKATMDGYACRRSDLEHSLKVIETIQAGGVPVKTPSVNECSAIMTGAMIPRGTDCVIPVEDVEMISPDIIRFKGSFVKENIAYKGEDIRKGDVVLRALREIKPQDIAVMATVGHVSVLVSKRPKVAVISSGDELVEPGYVPDISQIRNSNGSQLVAQVVRAGASAAYYGIAGDNVNVTFLILKKALSENDLVLISGGVSMGKFDFIPSVLERSGVRILFSRVAVQPGKPTTFGIHEKALVFGLPGNPVSSFIIFELMVRPLIAKMMQSSWQPEIVTLPLGSDYSRRVAERMAWLPVIITGEGTAEPVEYHGSGHISALPDADGIISVPVGKMNVGKGEPVKIRRI